MDQNEELSDLRKLIQDLKQEITYLQHENARLKQQFDLLELKEGIAEEKDLGMSS